MGEVTNARQLQRLVSVLLADCPERERRIYESPSSIPQFAVFDFADVLTRTQINSTRSRESQLQVETVPLSRGLRPIDPVRQQFFLIVNRLLRLNASAHQVVVA